jgi:hypothetical protein
VERAPSSTPRYRKGKANDIQFTILEDVLCSRGYEQGDVQCEIVAGMEGLTLDFAMRDMINVAR